MVLGSGVAASDGTFSIGISTTVNPGDTIEAHDGSAAGPVSNPQSAYVAPVGPPASGGTPLDAGATVLTVNGIPGQQVVIVDTSTSPDTVLGQGVVGSTGQVAVFMSGGATAGDVLDLVVGGFVEGTTTVGATGGQAASLDPGFVFVEGNTLTGHGVAGSTVQLVDGQGNVLGSAVVAANGTFNLPVSGAHAGSSLKLLQNGVAVDVSLTPQKLGENKVFLSKNVFKPELGGSLDIGFKAEADERVTVRIFNMAGELVRPVVEMDAKSGVVYALTWDGRNSEGQMVASGVYIVSAKGATTRVLKKVVVLK